MAIKSINVSGGDRSGGQRGGVGQKGARGTELGDASVDLDLGSTFFTPVFHVAFARAPGCGPTRSLDDEICESIFDVADELSGCGGNAGKAGFGGKGGGQGDVLIQDCKNISVELKNSINTHNSAAAKVVKSIQRKSGADGANASLDVLGGDAGEPGSYGLDHVALRWNTFYSVEQKKGDYSNYLLETSHYRSGIGGNDEKKRLAKSILKDPDLYARMSYIGAATGRSRCRSRYLSCIQSSYANRTCSHRGGIFRKHDRWICFCGWSCFSSIDSYTFGFIRILLHLSDF